MFWVPVEGVAPAVAQPQITAQEVALVRISLL